MEYECLSEKSGQIWCCKNFKKNMFSFFDLNDLKSILNDFKNFEWFKVKLICTKKKITTKPTQCQQTDANVTIRIKI